MSGQWCQLKNEAVQLAVEYVRRGYWVRVTRKQTTGPPGKWGYLVEWRG